MQEILKRLRRVASLEFLVFTDDTILNTPIEDWPIVDCLISFYSKGFPLDKAIEYAKLRKPVVLNDLEVQYRLQDRYLNFSQQQFSLIFLVSALDCSEVSTSVQE